MKEFCPLDEIDWEAAFHGARRPVTGSGSPDLGIDGLVMRYRAAYEDKERGDWIEQRLRIWFSQREASHEEPKNWS